MTETIYLIDDDTELARSLQFLLRTLKLPAIAFNSGESFIASVAQLPPGCVLLDLQMPGRNGIEVQQELARRGIHWPVVFMTGSIDFEERLAAVGGTPIEVLRKPFEDRELLDVLARAFAKLAEQGGAGEGH
jgi:two-component system response regulator FixJ